MRTRRTIAMWLTAVLAAATLFLAACGSDDAASGAKKSTTSTVKRETTTTMSDADFSAGVDKARNSLSEAGTDPCKVMSSFQSVVTDMGVPGNTEQRKQATELQLQVFRSIAAAAPKDLADEAATVTKGLDAIEKEGRDANWSEKFLKAPKASKDRAFQKASTDLMTGIAKTCPSPAGAPATDGAAPTGGATPTP